MERDGIVEICFNEWRTFQNRAIETGSRTPFLSRRCLVDWISPNAPDKRRTPPRRKLLVPIAPAPLSTRHRDWRRREREVPRRQPPKKRRRRCCVELYANWRIHPHRKYWRRILPWGDSRVPECEREMFGWRRARDGGRWVKLRIWFQSERN